MIGRPKRAEGLNVRKSRFIPGPGVRGGPYMSVRPSVRRLGKVPIYIVGKIKFYFNFFVSVCVLFLCLWSVVCGVFVVCGVCGVFFYVCVCHRG